MPANFFRSVKLENQTRKSFMCNLGGCKYVYAFIGYYFAFSFQCTEAIVDDGYVAFIRHKGK